MSISSDHQWGTQFYNHGGASDSSAVTHGCPNSSNSKPRRRSRASRKAPTTLLNASRANFRDLVQQFTGFQAAGAGVALGSHRGPVNLSFGQPGDHNMINDNHYSVMLPFSHAAQFQLPQPPPPTEPLPPESITGDCGFSRPAAELTEIQNLIDHEDHLNYDFQDLAMDFSSSNGNGNYSPVYFN